MNAAELFVQCLENEGVKTIFGVPGEENEAILFALENSSIQFIPCRHEQGASFIANVYGRLTGKAGVCLSTLGPGATNLITGVADANLDKSPLVAITAQGSLERTHHESHQMINVVNLFDPITKWNSSITSPEIIPEIIRKAFKLAEAEKPGATHIELPENIAEIAIDAMSPIPPNNVFRPSAHPSVIPSILQSIREHEKIIILAGNGAIRKRSSEQLSLFAQHFNIPVASTFMGKGSISDKLPQSLFAVGLGFKN